MTVPVVSVGTSTEGISGSGGSCCPAPDDDVKSGTDIDMRSIYNILYARISNLEKSVKEQFALIADLTRRGLRVDAGVQADIEKRDRLRATYTEVVKSTPSMQNVDRSATGHSVGCQTVFVDSASSSSSPWRTNATRVRRRNTCRNSFLDMFLHDPFAHHRNHAYGFQVLQKLTK